MSIQVTGEERSRERIAPTVEALSGPSQANVFLSKAEPALLGAAILGGAAAVGDRLETLLSNHS